MPQASHQDVFFTSVLCFSNSIKDLEGIYVSSLPACSLALAESLTAFPLSFRMNTLQTTTQLKAAVAGSLALSSDHDQVQRVMGVLSDFGIHSQRHFESLTREAERRDRLAFAITSLCVYSAFTLNGVMAILATPWLGKLAGDQDAKWPSLGAHVAALVPISAVTALFAAAITNGVPCLGFLLRGGFGTGGSRD